MANGNGGEQPQAAPQLNILAQFVKDLSFENPNAPKSLMPQSEQPQISIQVNVNAAPLSDNEFDVSLSIEGDAKIKDMVLFKIDLLYGGVFRLANIPAEFIHPTVMIECPRLIFPFARQIIANVTRDGGFPPLYLDPIDFGQLYQQRVAAMQQEQPTQ